MSKTLGWKKITGFVFCLIILYSGSSYAADMKKKMLEEVTNEQRNRGWTYVTYSYSSNDPNTVIITDSNVQQANRLVQGQLTNVLSFMLTPDIVKRLLKSGFKKGKFVDGQSRKYPFVVSTKYYNEMDAWYKSMSGGR